MAQQANNTQQQEQKDTEQASKGLFGSLMDKAAEVANEVGIIAKDVGNKTEQAAEDVIKKMETRISMQGQLKEAHESLARFLSPELELEKQIPVELMKCAKGIVLLSVLKVSVGVGGSVGSGVVIAKLQDGKSWSKPCSIGIMGGQWGLNIGAEKTNFVIILRDENALNVFSGKGQIKFGADASISAGPLGRNAQVAVNANDKGFTATVSYSESKGLYVGVALEGSGISVRQNCNEEYYGKKVVVKDILATPGESGKNTDYDAIVHLLSAYVAKMDAEKAKKKKKQDDDQ